MFTESRLTKNFWAEAVDTTYYVTNRCLIRSPKNKTPYELLFGRKPSISHLWAFGCKYFVLINNKEEVEKFDSKSDEGVFSGYFTSSKSLEYSTKGPCVLKKVCLSSLMNLEILKTLVIRIILTWRSYFNIKRTAWSMIPQLILLLTVMVQMIIRCWWRVYRRTWYIL